MRQSLLLLCILAAFISASGKDNLKLRIVAADDLSPVSNVELTVEYPDTVAVYMADRKGKAAFSPSSFPITITARANGMLDSTIGLMSMPSGTVRIELAPDPSVPRVASQRRVHWSSDRARRLSSTYVVRTPAAGH